MRASSRTRNFGTGRRLARIGLTVIGLLIFAGIVNAQTTQSPTLPKITRVLIPSDKAAALLADSGAGVFRGISVERFDKLIAAAKRAVQPRTDRAVLTVARYRCDLRGENLVGSGDWSIHNPTKGTAAFALDELHLALSNVRSDSKPAVLAVIDQPLLRVDKSGLNKIYFDWSLRGKATKSAFYFDFRVPTCALNELEVKLPVGDLLASASSGVLITGPHEYGDAERRLWRLRFSGRNRVTLVVHTAGTAQTERPLILTRLKTNTLLSHSELIEERTFFLEVYHRTVKEFTFLCPRTMQPIEVTSPAGFVQEWQVSRSGQRTAIHVVLRKPVGDVELPPITIRSRVPLRIKGQWRSPKLQLPGTLVLDEVLILRIAPSVELGQWSPEGFAIERMTRDKNGQRQYILRSHGDKSQIRPHGRMSIAGDLLTVDQIDNWHIDNEIEKLHSTYKIRLLRGQRHEVVIAQPKTGKGENAWEIVSVNAAPARIRRWSHLRKRSQLLLEFSATLPRNEPVQIDVVWKRRHLSASQQRTPRVLIPASRVLATGPYEGEMRISTSPDLAVKARPASDKVTTTDDTRPLVLKYRTRGPIGFLEIRRKPAIVQTFWKADAIRRGPKAAVSLVLDVRSMTFRLPFLRLAFHEPLAGPLTAKILGENGATSVPVSLDQVHSSGNAAALGGQINPLLCATLLPRCDMAVWRIPLEDSVNRRVRVLLETTVRGSPAADSGRTFWRLPIPHVVLDHADIMSRGTYHLYGFPEGTVHYTGDRSRPLAIDDNDGSMLLSTSGDTSGVLLSQSPVVDNHGEPAPVCESVDWLTVVRRDMDWLHCCRYRLRHWRSSTFRVELPGCSDFVAARIAGRRVDAVSIEQSGATTSVTIPVDRTSASQEVMIVWLTPVEKSLFGWQRRLQPPAIPVSPMSVRHRFRLEYGLTLAGGVESLSIIEQLPDAFRSMRSGWHAVDRHLFSPAGNSRSLGVNSMLSDWHRATQAFLERNIGRQTTLAQAVAEILLFHTSRPTAVYVDQAALSEENIEPKDRIAISGEDRSESLSLWEQCGLTVIAAGDKLILTTPARAGAARRNLLPFVEWIAADRPGSRPLPFPRILLAGTGWHEWQVKPFSKAVFIAVVDLSLVRVVAWTFAGLAFMGTWMLGVWLGARAVARLVLLAVPAMVIVPLWVPLEMGLFAILPFAAVPMSAVLWLVCRQLRVFCNLVAPNTALAVLVFGLVVSLHAFAGKGDRNSYLVYLLAERPDKALVPAQLLDQLEDLSRVKDLSWPSAVVVSADYHARVSKDILSLKAEFDVYCDADKATVMLPLSLGQLRDGTLVDGAPAYPLPLDDGRSGYRLVIQGKKGRIVRVSMPFETMIHADGSERYVDLQIAPAVQNRIEVAFTEKVEQPAVLGAAGMQIIESISGGTAKIICDIGRFEASKKDDAVRIQWRTALGGGVRPKVDVKEYHTCELHHGHTEWVSIFDFQVRRGGSRRLEVMLEGDAYLRAVELVRPTGGSLGSGIPIRDWRVAKEGSGRRVTVLTESPIRGKVLLILRWLSLRNSPEGVWNLDLPFALNAKVVNGAILLGCDGDFEVRQVVRVRLTRRPIDEFQKTWSQFFRATSNANQQAFTYRRPGGRGRITVSRVQPAVTYEQRVRWHLHPNGMELFARLRIKAAGGHANVVEWEVPAALEIEQIDSDSVADWETVQRKKDRRILRMWLVTDRDTADINIRGWLPNARLRMFGSSTAQRPAIVPIPIVRFANVQPSTSRIEVTGDGMWQIVPNRYGKLKLLRTAKDVAFEGDGGPYFITVAVLPVQRPPVGDSIVLYEIGPDHICLTGWLQTDIRGDIPSRIELQVDSWRDGRLPNLIVAADQGTSLTTVEGQGNRWKIHPQLLSRGRSRIQVSAVFPMPRTARFTLPIVRFKGVRMQTEVIALSGSGFDVKSARGCSRLEKLPQAEWSDDLAVLGAIGDFKVWSLEDADAAFEITTTDETSRQAARVIYGCDAINANGGNGWLHNTQYFFLAVRTADMRIDLPKGAALLAMDINTPGYCLADTNKESITVTLPEGPRIYRVQLLWREPETATSERLDLQAPRVRLLSGYPFRRDLMVSEGFFIDKPPVPQPRLQGWIDREEARTLVHVLEGLPRAAFTSSRDNLMRLERVCFRALLRYRAPSRGEFEPDTDDGDLIQRYSRLRERFGTSISDLLHDPATRPGDRAGTHLVWWDVETPARTITVSLGSVRRSFEIMRFWQTQVVLLLAGLAFALSFVPSIRRIAMWFWPESLLLAGILGTIAFGFSLLAGAVFAVALVARSALGLLRFRSWWRSRAVASSDRISAGS